MQAQIDSVAKMICNSCGEDPFSRSIRYQESSLLRWHDYVDIAKETIKLAAEKVKYDKKTK